MGRQEERPLASVIDYDRDVYETRDFNFTAFVLATVQRTKIVTLRPFRGNDMRTYFRIVFVGLDGFNVKSELEALYADYVGGRTTVEPNAYNTARNNLREIVIQNHNRRMHDSSSRREKRTKRNKKVEDHG